MNGNGVNGRVGGAGVGGGSSSLSSYQYTSGGGLLGRARPVPPPTLPRHSSASFSMPGAAAASVRERGDATGGSCRLASLERLALRQRLIDQPESTVSPPRDQALTYRTALRLGRLAYSKVFSWTIFHCV